VLRRSPRKVPLPWAIALASFVALGCAVAAPPAPQSAAASASRADAGAKPSDAKADKPSDAKPSKATKSKSTKSSKSRKRRRGDASAMAHTTSPSDADDTPAVRYAALTQDACEAELDRRGIGYTRETAVGVVAPVRLTGPLRGVTFRTDGNAEARASSPYEIADCRLVLALDDFAEILARFNIVEVRHYSMYRPPRGWPDGKIGGQHNGALALDAGRFVDNTGKTLDVDRDFHGRIGAKTCGDGAAPRPATPDALALREILCEAADRHLFNVVLTPNFNRPHHNHFHLEVMAGVRWFLLH